MVLLRMHLWQCSGYDRIYIDFWYYTQYVLLITVVLCGQPLSIIVIVQHLSSVHACYAIAEVVVRGWLCEASATAVTNILRSTAGRY